MRDLLKPDDGKGEDVSEQTQQRVDDDHEMTLRRCDGLSKTRNFVRRLDSERMTTGALQKFHTD